MNDEQVKDLIEKYCEEFVLPRGIERRIDDFSLQTIYAFIRELKPTSCLEIGTWQGGSTCTILSALIKNRQPFAFFASEILEDMQAKTKESCRLNCRQEPTIIGDITKSKSLLPEHLDFVLVDADHRKKTTKWIIKNVFPRVRGLVIIHDWCIVQKGKKFVPKPDGLWNEMKYYLWLLRRKKFPLEKIVWLNEFEPRHELGVFQK